MEGNMDVVHKIGPKFVRFTSQTIAEVVHIIRKYNGLNILVLTAYLFSLMGEQI